MNVPGAEAGSGAVPRCRASAESRRRDCAARRWLTSLSRWQEAGLAAGFRS